ncbi:hypothetical protein [Kitasatospora sp. CB02891]|uniref:hypothetical protein n=1 Tax=Kitasatospora sp. CB02891 TaxID=2020329 RepID=UPI000C281109|nr:hypothetical protein [Kitasatospora sp. CB02891]PJN25528.1 hypothetical protein CG736_14095 [Kitasatospora sp. CB02891]
MSEGYQGTVPEPDGGQAVAPPGAIGAAGADEAAGGADIHYVFPIHVVLAGGTDRATGAVAADTVYDALYRALS